MNIYDLFRHMYTKNGEMGEVGGYLLRCWEFVVQRTAHAHLNDQYKFPRESFLLLMQSEVQKYDV